MADHREKYFKGNRIFPGPIEGELSIKNLIDGYFNSYNAARIQETVSTYFLIQRIKAKIATQEEAYEDYVQKTTNLHQLMVAAMKCKQTLDQKHVQAGLKLLDKFVNLYFDEHGREHLKAITGTL